MARQTVDADVWRDRVSEVEAERGVSPSVRELEVLR
jgi:hypothetical protein